MTQPAIKRRRWLRYSMRTMLVAVTLLCLVLALVVVPAERQRRAVEKIRRLKYASFVTYDYQYRGDYDWGAELRGPAWLRRWVGDDYFQDIVYAHVQLDRGDELTPDDLAALRGLRHLAALNMPFADDGMLALSRLKRLEALYLSSNKISDGGLEHLSTLTELKLLGVSSDQITGEGLIGLQVAGKLKWLDVRSNRVTFRGMEAVAQLTSLERLSVHSDSLTDECLKPLSKLTSLRSLTIAGRDYSADAPKGVTDAGIQYIVRLANLEDLKLISLDITDAGLSHLGKLQRLRSLDIANDQPMYTEDGIAALQDQLPNLRVKHSAWKPIRGKPVGITFEAVPKSSRTSVAPKENAPDSEKAR